MIMQGITPPLSATGAVLVSSFVKMDSAVKYCVKQAAGPQDLIIGVSQQGSYYTPGTPGSNTTKCTEDNVDATHPSQIAVYGVGSVVRLQLSANCGTILPGAILTSDTDGTGINLDNPVIQALELSYAGAIALTNGSAGQFIRVLVIAPFSIGAGGAQASVRVSLTPSTVGAWTAADQTFSVAGLNGNVNSPVVVSGEALTAGLAIGNAIILSAGSIKIRFVNATQTSIVPAAQWFDLAVVG